jgi:predicted RNA methylase
MIYTQTIRIAPEAQRVLDASTVEDIDSAFVLRLPSGKLERAVYTSVDKALRALGGKWDRRVGGHVFDRDPRGGVAVAATEGALEDKKKTLQQFFTPTDVATLVTNLAGVSDGDTVLEPSAGAGALVSAALARGATVTALEVDADLLPVLKELPRTKAFCADFTEWDATTKFDVVLMNPPFSKGRDIKHVTHALKFVKPGGVLAAIMPTSWQTGQTKAHKAFTTLIGSHDWRWVPLAASSFKESGTQVDTGVLVLQTRGV